MRQMSMIRPHMQGLPPIGRYLSLGFEPVIDEQEMEGRWNAVREKRKERKSV